MKRGRRPTVLVYNPISGHGHLDSWNALFVALLLSRGWHVLALTPDAATLLERLDYRGTAHRERLQVLDWNAHVSRSRGWLRELWRRWDRFGDRYFHGRPGSELKPDLPRAEYWRRRVYRAVVPFLFRASYFVYTRWQRLRRPAAAASEPEQDPHAACPIEMGRRVNAALRKARWQPDLVFNMYMDAYGTSAARWDAFARGNALPWAGIRFVPAARPQEPWYELDAWRCMCLLDEDVCRDYAAARPQQYFAYLPDITETALPDAPSELARQIKARAAGRRIVFLGGSIGGQKNLARWFECVARADPAVWFFVQIGEIHRGTLTPQDLAALDAALARPPEHLLLHASYLPDERAFNEVIELSDVIFAVYREFRISSNMLSKASHFGKPVLVSKRYLLGRRVETYGIGATVDEDDAADIVAGLERVVRHPVPRSRFERYASDHSESALAERLVRFLNECTLYGE